MNMIIISLTSSILSTGKNILGSNLCSRLKDKKFESITQNFSEKLEARNSNIYFHNGVTNPRIHHIDSVSLL